MIDRIRRPKRGLLADTLWRALWGCAVAALLMAVFGLMPPPQQKFRDWLHGQLAQVRAALPE